MTRRQHKNVSLLFSNFNKSSYSTFVWYSSNLNDSTFVCIYWICETRIDRSVTQTQFMRETLVASLHIYMYKCRVLGLGIYQQYYSFISWVVSSFCSKYQWVFSICQALNSWIPREMNDVKNFSQQYNPIIYNIFTVKSPK